MDLAAPSHPESDLGRRLPELTWVQPIPSEAVLGEDPIDRAVASESIRLAFVAALQHLLPRQRAVLILRDVLRWRASEVAELLDTSTDAVHSTLRRARRVLEAVSPDVASPSGTVDAELLEAYVEAFRRFDIDRIVALLRADVVVSMPPFSFWLRGRPAFETFLRTAGPGCGHAHLMVIEANGGPGVALYDRQTAGGLVASAIHVLETQGGKISAIHAFLDPGLFPRFGLPIQMDHAREAGQLK
jgi:RNA polymerase sigma-70 factor, ECF subfamily